MNDALNKSPVEIFAIDGDFKVERKSVINQLGVTVYVDEVFKNGVSVLTRHSMETQPLDAYNTYLKLQAENAAYEKAQNDYKEFPYEEKNNYWRVYAQKYVYEGNKFEGSTIIKVAELRTQEPEINRFIDDMIQSVADLWAISYEDALTDHFEIDEAGKDFVRMSSQRDRT